MKKLVFCLVCTVVFLNIDIFLTESANAENQKSLIQNPPVYRSPLKKHDAKQRREFGDEQGSNRGIKVRGIKSTWHKSKGIVRRLFKYRRSSR